MHEDVDLQLAAVEKLMGEMARALRKIQCHSPGMDAGALRYSLGIATRMEEAADDLKSAAKLLRETSVNWMEHRKYEFNKA